MNCDCHIHVVLDGENWREALARHREHPDEVWIRRLLEEYAAGGVSFLRDGGDRFGATALAKKLAPEYDIDYRTPLWPICKKGRYGSFIGRTFEDFESYKGLVDEAKSEGADFIKIMISGIMDFDHFGAITSEPLSSHELEDMIGYAHSEGLSVMAHANGSQVIRCAVSAGVDSIEHGAYMDEECVSVLAKSSAVWVPTLSTIANLVGCGRYPDTVLEPLLAFQKKNIRRFLSLGGCIAAGSDAGAYRVFHSQGASDEETLLLELCCKAELERGCRLIAERFCPH